MIGRVLAELLTFYQRHPHLFSAWYYIRALFNCAGVCFMKIKIHLTGIDPGPETFDLSVYVIYLVVG